MSWIQQQAYNIATPVVTSATINFDGTTGTTGAILNKPIPCEAIYVGGAGIVDAVLENCLVRSFTCVAGETLLIKAIRINATSTATLMQALYTV